MKKFQHIFLGMRDGQGLGSNSTCLALVKHIAGTLLLLCISAGQVWGDTVVKGGYIYFDEYNSGYTGASDMQFWCGHGSYSCAYSMTKITNTKLWYYSASNWDNATYFAFASSTSGWGCEGNDYYSRIGTYPWKSGKKESYTLNSGSYFVFKAASTENKAAVNSDPPYGYQGTAVSSLNKSQTINVAVSTDGGSTYTTPSTSPATISFSSKTFSNASTCGTSSTGSFSGSTKTMSKNAGYTATTTLTYSLMSSDYTFVCWHDGSSSVGTGTSYEYYPTSTNTITARFTKNFTVGDKIYLLRNSTWKNASGLNHYAAYFYGSGGNTWVNCTQVGTSDYYSVTVPSGNWGYVIFVALNNASNSWSYKIYQTDDLMYDASHNGVEITGGSNSQNRITVYTGITVSRTPTAGASAPTITNSQTVVKSGSSVTINANNANTGYHWVNWTKTSGTLGNANNQSTTFTPSANSASAVANYAINTQTVTFNKNGGTGTTMSSLVFTYGVAQALTSNSYTAPTGYYFGGWATSKANADAGTVAYTNGQSITLNPATHGTTLPLYAVWKGKQSTLSFDYQTSAEGYGSSGSVSVATKATYGSAMPTLSGAVPTAANGYCFMGFYSGTLGTGTKYYNADKSSANNWAEDTESPTTLYAYYKKAEVTNITLSANAFEPADAEATPVYVTATPTISPEPVAPTTICWEMLYENDNPVPAGHDPETVSGNTVRFPINGLSPGSYKIRATLRTGASCAAGTELSYFDKTFAIASDHTVTIVYKCGTEVIAPSTEVENVKPLEWSSGITAPTIFGYTFSNWIAGDGITIKTGETTSATTHIKASYEGTLTANYTKIDYIYFKNTMGWDHVDVYFYTSDKYWDDTEYGSGSQYNKEFKNGDDNHHKPHWDKKRGRMTRIAGTDIWYLDAGAIGCADWSNVVFNANTQNDYEWFSATELVRRGDFNKGTPMFVPAPKNTYDPITKNTNAKYYNKGYWVNYLGERTGYTLEIYNSDGSSLIKSVKFPSADKLMPMVVATDLEANHNYQFQIRRDNDIIYGNTGTMNYANHGQSEPWKFESGKGKCTVTTNAAGDYTFHLTYAKTASDEYHLRIYIEYPIATGDYRVIYKDNDHPLWHPSAIIQKVNNGKDIVSFFVRPSSTPVMKIQQATVNASTGAISWSAGTDITSSAGLTSLSGNGVYNICLAMNGSGAISVEKVEPYTGDFYIRTDIANNKWDNYRASDHRMTYSSFSESDENSFGEKYSHYYMHWCPYSTNIKFVVANDYSPCISDTLVADHTNYNNMDEYGTLKTDGNSEATENRYSANVRFMWNRSTNRVSRAYVGSSTNKDRKFLVLRANATIWGEDNIAVSEGFTNGVILDDKQNWMYETTLYITPGTKFKLLACYAEATPTQSGAQYFRGHYASDNWSDANTVVLIGGSGVKQKARVIYDFKTNRLIAAWIPTAGSAVSGDLAINADVLIEREHQEAAQCVTFANASSKLSGVKTVYGAMKFNRWILNNRGGSADEDPDHGKTDDQLTTYHPVLDVGQQKSIYERCHYYISFPFDVRVSDIFGFGRYWDHWYLEYYDGLNRAKNGYWLDSPPNWKYVTTEMADTMVLRANVGYILGLDLDFMQANDYEFWSNGISTVELFFPSTTNLETLKQTTCTIPALSSEYKCTINRPGDDGDRRVKDSYWRCIGVPSLNLYNSALTDGSGNTITWKTDYTWHENESEFPFIYMWNKADNTLTPQSTSTFRFLPMHSYLVQNGGQIIWTNASAKPSSIVSRRENDYQQIDYNWRLELAKDSQMVDQAYIRMSNLEQVTDTFDFGQDLSKEFNATRSNIYSFIGYEKAAANSMPLKTEQTTIVAIGLNIITAGEYTLGMPDGTDGVGVTLVDSETGTRTNLSALDYTVTLAAGDYTSRFYLEISPVKETPTGLEQLPTTNDQSPIKKLLIDGILYIVRDGKIFDARGVMVK